MRRFLPTFGFCLRSSHEPLCEASIESGAFNPPFLRAAEHEHDDRQTSATDDGNMYLVQHFDNSRDASKQEISTNDICIMSDP